MRHFLLPVALVCILGLSADTPPDAGRLVTKSEFFDGRTDWHTAGSILSWRQVGPRLTLELSSGRSATLDFGEGGVVHFFWDPANRAGDSSVAIANLPAGVTPVVTEREGTLIAETKGLKLEISRTDFGLKLFRNGSLVASTSRPPAFSQHRIATYWTIAEQDRFYGLGEKAGPLLKNGQSVKMWNTDAYAWSRASDPLYISVPFVLASRSDAAWGLFLDNSSQTFFNLGRDQAGEARLGAVDGPLDLWLFAGAAVPDVVASYTALTGRIPLPPAWALGYHQSKYSYATQQEVLDTAHRFVRERLPAKVIYLDIDFMDGYKSFTFDKTAFPDPKAMVDELHALGFRVVAIVDPGIKVEPGYAVYDSGLAANAFFRDASGTLLTGKVWPGVCAFPDFRSAEIQKWWGEQYRVLTDLGIDGFWNDMNEPSVFNGPGGTLSLDPPHDRLHNLYGDLMVRATRAGLEALRPGVRPFVLSRDGYAGTQRWAAHWTGDNVANWDHLKLNLTQVINLGLSGYALTGADVGGYKGNPDPELFVRWMQLGSLMPYFRNHTEKGHYGHEPWQFGAEALDKSRVALEFRDGLQPYLYDLVAEAAATGAPLVRPLFWSFPQDGSVAKIDDEFLLGDALLAAPVLSAGASTRSVVLPAGAAWYRWSTGESFEGGQTLRLPVDLGSVPLFVREGSVVPWKGKEGLEFRVFPGTPRAVQHYEDDGETTAFASGAYAASELWAPQTAAGELTWTAVHAWSGATRSAMAVFPDGRRTPVTLH